MFTFSVYSRVNRGNDLAVWVRHRGRKTEFSLGVEMTPEVLDRIKAGTVEAKLLRWQKYYQHVLQVINDVGIELVTSGRLEEVSSADIRDMIRERLFGISPDDDKALFLRYFETTLALRRNAGYRTSCLYTMRKVEAYLQLHDKDDILFDEINIGWLRGFEEWLISEGAAHNSTVIHFKNIRTVFNRAIDDEITSNYPFRRFKIRPEETRKRSLTSKDLRRLFTCEVEPYQEFYRDMFKLIFMLIGINVVDLYNLREVTGDGRIEYKRAKTGRLYSIKVEPEAQAIIDKWRGVKGLTVASDRWRRHNEFGKYTNQALQKVGDLTRSGLGGKKIIKPFFPELTTYWARHSWASIAYYLDVPKDVISHALGHSSGSDITEIYIDRDRAKVDRANRLVLDFVLYNSEERW